MRLVSIGLFAAVTAEMRPGKYNTEPSDIHPVVSLCDSDAIRVNEFGTVDFCLTITPVVENKVAKSYSCEALPTTSTRENKYRLVETGNSCMVKMRTFAKSVGISLGVPIEFDYEFEASDPSGDNQSVGKISVHLKWDQQNRPFILQQAGSSAVGIHGPSPWFLGFVLAVAAWI